MLCVGLCISITVPPSPTFLLPPTEARQLAKAMHDGMQELKLQLANNQILKDRLDSSAASGGWGVGGGGREGGGGSQNSEAYVIVSRSCVSLSSLLTKDPLAIVETPMVWRYCFCVCIYIYTLHVSIYESMINPHPVPY